MSAHCSPSSVRAAGGSWTGRSPGRPSPPPSPRSCSPPSSRRRPRPPCRAPRGRRRCGRWRCRPPRCSAGWWARGRRAAGRRRPSPRRSAAETRVTPTSPSWLHITPRTGQLACTRRLAWMPSYIWYNIITYHAGQPSPWIFSCIWKCIPCKIRTLTGSRMCISNTGL